MMTFGNEKELDPIPSPTHAPLRVALALAVAVGALALSFVLAATLHSSFAPPVAQACCTGNFYGGNSTLVNNATQSIYPEWQNSSQGPTCNCGIETAMAMTNYADQLYYGNTTHDKFTKQSDQNIVDTGNQQTASKPMGDTPDHQHDECVWRSGQHCQGLWH